MALRKGEKRMTYEEAKQKLMPVGQEHLLQYFEELGEEEKKSLLKQIEDLDLSLLNLIEGGVKVFPVTKTQGIILPLTSNLSPLHTHRLKLCGRLGKKQ